MLLLLTILATSYSLSFAKPGPCPAVKLATVSDPSKMVGFWYQPFQSWPPNVPLEYKCVTSSWSNWNPTTGSITWIDDFVLMNNTKLTNNGTMARHTNDSSWLITDNEGSFQTFILNYVENENIFFYTCGEQNGGKNHTNAAFVFTRDLKNYWTYWWRVFVTVVVNKLYDLDLITVPYNDCPK